MPPFSPYLLLLALVLIALGVAFWDYRRICRRTNGRDS